MPKIKPTVAKHPARPTGARAAVELPRWTFLTNHAHVLIQLYADSELVLREVADRVGITERAVQRIVQELEEGGFIEREKIGRRNHYRVLTDNHLRHPMEAHCQLEDFLGLVVEKKVVKKK